MTTIHRKNPGKMPLEATPAANPPGVARPLAVPSSGHIKRTEAARMLNCSVSKLRRLEPTVLQPTVDDSGIHWHSVERITEYRLECQQSGAPQSESDEGRIAAAAFEEFDAGGNAADAVKRLQLTPQVARTLFAEWADLRGGFVVTGKVAAEFDVHEHKNDFRPIRTGQDLLRALEGTKFASCGSCERRRARICLHCYEGRAKRAEAMIADATAANAAEHDRRRELAVVEHAGTVAAGERVEVSSEARRTKKSLRGASHRAGARV